MADGLTIKVINDYLLNKHNKNKKDKIEKFYPSSVGKCSRAIVYSMMGYPMKVPSERVLLIFENGHSFHNRMEHIFREAGILVADELPIKNEELNISGRSDAVIIDPDYKPSANEEIITLFGMDNEILYIGPVGQVIIVELKSINNKGFLRLREPKDEHIKQLQLYMYLTGIKRGILLYENKDTQELLEFEIPYDERIAIQVINKIYSINEHVKNGTIPEKEFNRSDFECRYCDYKDICWPDNTVKSSLEQLLNICEQG